MGLDPLLYSAGVLTFIVICLSSFFFVVSLIISQALLMSKYKNKNGQNVKDIGSN